ATRSFRGVRLRRCRKRRAGAFVIGSVGSVSSRGWRRSGGRVPRLERCLPHERIAGARRHGEWIAFGGGTRSTSRSRWLLLGRRRSMRSGGRGCGDVRCSDLATAPVQRVRLSPFPLCPHHAPIAATASVIALSDESHGARLVAGGAKRARSVVTGALLVG